MTPDNDGVESDLIFI